MTAEQTEKDLHIFIVTGEPSGDLLGAKLMQGLKIRTEGRVRFSGIGGERMIAEDLTPLFPQRELAVFGIFELVRNLPNLLRRIRQTIQAVKAAKPDALVTIDSPDFSFRVAKKCVGLGFPLIHYVAPTVWAWRPKRAKKIAAFLDHLLVVLPFEPPYFEKEGLPTSFVGHPIIENGAERGDAMRFRTTHHLAADTPILTVLPGSRMGEVSRLLPIFGQVAERLARTHPSLVLAVPTVETVAEVVTEATRTWPLKTLVFRGDAPKYDAFAASLCALAASGTIALELAMARLPAVIVYRLNALTVFLYRHFIKIKYANLVNLMHGKMVVPELLQENCTADKITAAITTLLQDPAARQAQITGYQTVGHWLGQNGPPPGLRAADVVLDVIRARNR
jgi:lipid-A-disaccharide synthase